LPGCVTHTPGNLKEVIMLHVRGLTMVVEIYLGVLKQYSLSAKEKALASEREGLLVRHGFASAR
jgi:hypothetical protein